jgi:hypothetical protein
MPIHILNFCMEILDDVMFLYMFKKLGHMQHTNIFLYILYFWNKKKCSNQRIKKKIQTKPKDIVFLLTQTGRSRWIDPYGLTQKQLTWLSWPNRVDSETNQQKKPKLK